MMLRGSKPPAPEPHIHLLILLIVSFNFFNCSSNEVNSQNVSFDGKWELIEMKETPGFPPETYLYINGVNKTFQTSGGCNTFNGTYEIDGTIIIFNPPAGTRKYCSELTSFEAEYVSLLTGTTEIQIQRNVMQLLLNGSVILAFRKAKQ